MGGKNSSPLYQSIAKDPRHHTSEVRALFKLYDKNKDGVIDGEEVGKFVKELLDHLKKLNDGEDLEINLEELKQSDKLTFESFNGLLVRYLEDIQPELEVKRVPPKPKEFKQMVDAFVGTWKGSSAHKGKSSDPDVLAVTPLPQNTLHVLKDFILCNHANLEETLIIREPIPWKDQYLSCEYRQTIMDTTPDLVHEETGMFLFNMQDGTITRHGIIPHGSTFVMKGSLMWEDGKAPQIPKTKTIPLMAPDFTSEVRGAAFSNAYNGGLDHNMVFANTNIPVSNPAVMLQEANRGKDFKEVIIFDFPETKSMDLEFVNNMSRGEKRFIKKGSSTFWLFREGAEWQMQYIQTIMFDFPTNIPLVVPGKIVETDNIRWPHVTLAKLKKQ